MYIISNDELNPARHCFFYIKYINYNNGPSYFLHIITYTSCERNKMHNKSRLLFMPRRFRVTFSHSRRKLSKDPSDKVPIQEFKS